MAPGIFATPRVARCLDDYGGRVQYSVFEAVLDRPLFDKMVAELDRLIDPSRDHVLVYPVCAACRRKAVFLGWSAIETRPGEELTFIV
jgi:CRISPR-associated protein Cas2